MTVHISSTGQWRQILGSSSIVVTDFYADWCGPCKMIAPTFESLATKYAKPNRITFAKVDVDRQQEIAQQYGVRAMPTFLILRNGSVINTIQGANPPALTAAVDKAVKLAGAATPGAVFSTPGHTLGGSGSSSGSSSGIGSSARSSAGLGARVGAGPAARLARGPSAVSRGSFDLNRLINNLITFFGLYFSSLISLDPYMSAKSSQFNIHNLNVSTPSVAFRAGGAPPVRAPAQPKSSVRTLADLDAE